MKPLEQITEELKAPFNEDKIEFKIGATNQDKTMGLALAYVEARSIQDRLDKVIGFSNWKVSYKEVQGGFFCCLSLRIDNEWIEKWDGAQITEFESIKGGISSAFKRVASSGWGVGRYLYDVRNQWYPIRKSGKSYDFTINPTIDVKKDPLQTNRTTQEEQSKDKIAKARMFKITFGKYSGKILGDIFKSDTRYIDYLIDKSQDINLVNACKYLKAKGEIDS